FWNWALEYAKPGVILGFLGRNEERLNQIFQRCKDKGAECVMLKIDISNTEDLTKILEYFDDDRDNSDIVE
ncbi:18344_t:CDS:2, partial [Gigaspora rosea]